MRRHLNPRGILVLLAGGAILAAMQASTPYYDDVFRPFPVAANSGETAVGRLFDAQFTDWQQAIRIRIPGNAAPVTRTTEGVFLIVGMRISGVRQTVPIEAVWLGSSGRRYAASLRFPDSGLALETLRVNPHLVTAARAVFELPPDEVPGGWLVLGAKGMTVLDSALQLAPPESAPILIPVHEAGP